jgi:hypothetical protein
MVLHNSVKHINICNDSTRTVSLFYGIFRAVVPKIFSAANNLTLSLIISPAGVFYKICTNPRVLLTNKEENTGIILPVIAH